MKSSSNKTSSSKKSTSSTPAKQTRAKKSTSAPKAKKSENQLKYEIASEFGVKLGADSSARQNGKVGGEITKRLVKLAQSNLESSSNK